MSVVPDYLSAAAASRAFADGTLTPTALMGALLERIARIDPIINAFIRLDGDVAMEAAAQASREIAAGRKRGPLHGIPVGIKDIIDVAGLPTTCHSKILVDNIARSDAAVVARLRAAGAIPFGKLSTHEFAIGGPSLDLPFPPARNPWNPACHPGGSSSGSGAGLAAGLFPLALGTDTGGSVRNPASACGIIGLKPTYGLVSRRGVFPLAFSLDHVGPMARTAEDAALLLDAIAGHDSADAGSAPAAITGFTRALGRGFKGLRIGFVRHFHETDMPADPDVAAALEEAARILTAEGAMVETVVLPALGEFSAVNRVIMGAEAWSIHAPWLRSRPEDYGALARERLMMGAFLTGGDYVGAQRRRTQMIAAVDAVLGEYDLLLCASSMDPATRIDEAEKTERYYARQARTPFNVTGHPAVAMMAGLSQGGMPVSLQFVGRFFDDAAVLGAAAAWERAAGWAARHPELPA